MVATLNDTLTNTSSARDGCIVGGIMHSMSRPTRARKLVISHDCASFVWSLFGLHRQDDGVGNPGADLVAVDGDACLAQLWFEVGGVGTGEVGEGFDI